MRIVKYKEVKAGEFIEEKILENIVWCEEFSAITNSPATHDYALRIWYSVEKE